MENRGENLKIKEKNADYSKPICNFASNDKSKEPIYLKMENRDSNLKMKGNAGGFKGILTKTPISGKEDGGERMRVLETLDMFRGKCKELSKSKAAFAAISEKRNRIDFRAKSELLEQRKLRICSSKTLGSVPGVNVGDRFKYRVELNIVGLHGRVQHGIDYMEYGGRTLATCVVASEGYEDKLSDSEVITYMGEGGKEKDFFTDQTLTRGNLALKNSMIAKTDVRVVRGLKIRAKFGDWRHEMITYIYDGLYKVVSYEEKSGQSKNVVFEFKLQRCTGQPVVPWHKFKRC